MNTRLDHVQQWLALGRQANWSVAKLARLGGVSTRTLERHFLKKIGKAPKTWLVEQRQKTAAELLRNGYAVKETATMLGYNHPNHFSRDFNSFWGYAPTKQSIHSGTV